jgi:DUF1680 family protein
MLSYIIDNKLSPPELSDLRFRGKIAEQTETFFTQRVRSDYAKNVIYAETEEQFRIRNDDKTIVGMWRGEFWGKWIISACRVARYEHDDELRDFIHKAALNLIATADPDGYIGTYKDPENFYPCDPEAAKKVVGWGSNWNWNIWCRKYTLWGLLECYELTGDEKIINAAIKFTNQLIDMLERGNVRLGDTGTFNGLPSGSIMKPMLILYRITEKRKYLDFAIKIAEDWDRPDGKIPNIIANALAMKPVHSWYDKSEKWAKAYEMMSCLDGLLELYRVTGVKKYLKAVENMYTLLSEHELNVLFSVGFNDIFANASKYPNAISEPCDVIHWMRICHELYKLTGEIKYIDSIERAFYNPFLAGAFADGKWGARGVRSSGRHMVATGQADMKYSHCCVNNMPRGFLNAAETFVMKGSDGIYLNLYSDFECVIDGSEVKICGSYLRDGRVTISIDLLEETDVHLRIPSWSKTCKIGDRVYSSPGSYVALRYPSGQSRITLEFDMTPIIIDMPSVPESFPDSDFRVSRFITGNNVSRDIMTWDRRSVVLYGALLLTRSKLVGNTEDEMFNSDTICRKGYACEVIPIESYNVRNAFIVRFKNTNGSFETNMCDFASGSNRWSEDDDRLFNIYV